MSIIDAELLFGADIDLGSISASGSVDGTNTIGVLQITDHKGSASVNDRINEGGRLRVNVVVTSEALDAATSGAVLTMRVFNHTGRSSITSSGDQIMEHKALTIDSAGANFPKGTMLWSAPLPAGQLKEYLGINFSVVTQNMNAGKVTAWISDSHQTA